MKNKLLLFTFLMVVIGIYSVPVFSEDQATGAARLHQIDQSGIQARIVFLDSGSPLNQLVVNGEATGLDPEQTYISLIYDNGAVPGGPNACVPSSNPLTSTQMSVGAWTVSEDGTGTLSAIKTGSSYAPLSDIGAMSVRVVLGPPPAGAVLQACGRVHSNN